MVVSNRGPVTFKSGPAGERCWSRGAGGLITALDAVLSSTPALWVAAAMNAEDREVSREGELVPVPTDNPLYHVSLVDIDPETYDLYYNQICNNILWFWQHYLFDAAVAPSFTPKEKHAWRAGYERVNEIFARKILEVIADEPEPVIMIQDYHLYLVGEILRLARPDARLLHFVHIPWPSPDYFRLLPSDFRGKILRSMLACDVVGFHSRRYSQNFAQCCHEFLGHPIDLSVPEVSLGSRTVQINAYPISLSVEGLLKTTEHEDFKAWREKIRAARGDCRLIVRVDRAELSKNIVRGFDAFELLLETHSELRGHVKFLAYAYPTRQSLPVYQKYQAEIESRAARINEKFSQDGWQPVELTMADNYPRALAALTEYDVLLTNPVFDGMNLVAKEAAVLNERDGVIVLSENAGAYEEMRDGVLGVNPFDIEETMSQMYAALTMTPLERAMRAQRVKEIVVRNDSVKWLSHQVRDLLNVKRAGGGRSTSSGTARPRKRSRRNSPLRAQDLPETPSPSPR